jgi:hypothetical protein
MRREHFVDELPRIPPGKIQKLCRRQRYEATSSRASLRPAAPESQESCPCTQRGPILRQPEFTKPHGVMHQGMRRSHRQQAGRFSCSGVGRVV